MKFFLTFKIISRGGSGPPTTNLAKLVNFFRRKRDLRDWDLEVIDRIVKKVGSFGDNT